MLFSMETKLDQNSILLQADIWCFPSLERVHAAIGQEVKKSIFSADPGGRNTSGLYSYLYLGRTISETEQVLSCLYAFIIGAKQVLDLLQWI